jgi:hypothetical protein
MVIWKPIARFSYKDKHINYSCDIRVRKYMKKMSACVCGAKYNNKKMVGEKCPHCTKSRFKEEKVPVYVAYVAKGHDYLNVVELLSKNTCGNWKAYQYSRESYGQNSGRYRVGNLSPVFYAMSLASIYDGMKLITLCTCSNPNCKGKRRGVAKLDVFKITEEDIEISFKKSKNIKLLRMI